MEQRDSHCPCPRAREPTAKGTGLGTQRGKKTLLSLTLAGPRARRAREARRGAASLCGRVRARCSAGGEFGWGGTRATANARVRRRAPRGWKPRVAHKGKCPPRAARARRAPETGASRSLAAGAGSTKGSRAGTAGRAAVRPRAAPLRPACHGWTHLSRHGHARTAAAKTTRGAALCGASFCEPLRRPLPGARASECMCGGCWGCMWGMVMARMCCG